MGLGRDYNWNRKSALKQAIELLITIYLACSGF